MIKTSKQIFQGCSNFSIDDDKKWIPIEEVGEAIDNLCDHFKYREPRVVFVLPSVWIEDKEYNIKEFLEKELGLKK